MAGVREVGEVGGPPKYTTLLIGVIVQGGWVPTPPPRGPHRVLDARKAPPPIKITHP